MRSPRTLNRYVAREIITYSSLGLLAITSIMVTQKLFRFLDNILVARASWADVGTVIGHLALMLVSYTIPIAFLFGVLLALGRLAADSEITAMQSCGVGLPTLFRPLVILGVIASALTGYLLIRVEHQAHFELRQTIGTMAARGGFIEPKKFRRMGDHMLYVREVDSRNQLMGIVISDRSDPEQPLMIFAERGKLNWNQKGRELEFTLTNGDIHVEADPNIRGAQEGNERYQRISFQSFDYQVEEDFLVGGKFSVLRPREMSIPQLRAVIAHAEAGGSLQHLRRHSPVHYQLQIHQRIALPFAPLLFGLIGGALGLTPRRGTRSWAAILCVVLVFGYYAALSSGQYLALEGIIPSLVAAWAPNFVFAVGASFLWVRANRLRA
jgi:LPS export ABC transporter permease LptF